MLEPESKLVIWVILSYLLTLSAEVEFYTILGNRCLNYIVYSFGVLATFGFTTLKDISFK